jgi:hypothetical protein
VPLPLPLPRARRLTNPDRGLPIVGGGPAERGLPVALPALGPAEPAAANTGTADAELELGLGRVDEVKVDTKASAAGTPAGDAALVGEAVLAAAG